MEKPSNKYGRWDVLHSLLDSVRKVASTWMYSMRNFVMHTCIQLEDCVKNQWSITWKTIIIHVCQNVFHAIMLCLKINMK